jgi:hypothetical protein
MKNKFLFLIVIVFTMAVSCTKDTLVPPVKVPVNTSVKFSTDVYPIFSAHSCTGCHGTAGGLTLSGTPSAVRANLLVSVVIPNSSATSILYTTFYGASHKGISMTTTELNNLKSWIDLGALDN